MSDDDVDDEPLLPVDDELLVLCAWTGAVIVG